MWPTFLVNKVKRYFFKTFQWIYSHWHGSHRAILSGITAILAGSEVKKQFF